MHTETKSAAELRLHDASPEQRSVMTALAVGGTYRSASWIIAMRDLLGEPPGAKRMTNKHLHEVLQELAASGHIAEYRKGGAWTLTPSADAAVLLSLLARPDFGSFAERLARQDRVDKPYGYFSSQAEAGALVRLELLAGQKTAAVLERWRWAFRYGNSHEALIAALASLREPALFRHLHPTVQIDLVRQGLLRVLNDWEPETRPLVVLAGSLLGTATAAADAGLRLLLIEHRLCSGHAQEIAALLPPLREASGEDAARSQALAQAAEAAVLASQGCWPEAQARYEAALAVLRKPPGPRKGALPAGLMQPYLQCLLAQPTPECLDKALKLCLTEAGQRQPTPETAWGLAALAIQMRRGDIARDPRVFMVSRGNALQSELWRWLLRAWLKEGGAAQALTDAEQKVARTLLARLQSAGLGQLHTQLEDALNVLAARPTRPTFFVPPAQESWRAALAALAALGDSGAAPAGGASKSAQTRVTWVLEIDEDGMLLEINPHEQKHGARGWGKPQALSLGKLANADHLAPHDAQVARCIRRIPGRSVRTMMIDGATALQALIGHPAVEFSDRPGVAVTLEAGAPQLEVVEAGESLRLTLDVPLRAHDDGEYGDYDDFAVEPDGLRDSAELANTTVVRDGPQRARVVTFTPAQRRAALLLGEGLTVPKAAQAQLQAALQGLGAHFQVHADSPPDAQDVPAQSELRAELTPLGDGLRLRLVAAPFGPDGPRTVPGHGRSRTIAAVKGRTLAVQRDLAAEQRHVAAVLEACPLLGGAGSGMGNDSTEFEVADAEDALALLEVLPRVPGVQALDWPAGRPVSVAPVGLEHLRVRTQSQGKGPWFALAGGVQIDEAQVYALEQLMQWSRGSRGRFVPLGDGRYLALTQELRARIADLAAVAEVQGAEGGVARVPAAAALWLDAALQGADWQAHGALRQRLDRLAASAAVVPALPTTLQAELRPYQLEGYQWAQRLAAAGWGACLADDMGLGKTLQALAVLLARAADGPALVVAPTSLMGNWQAEGRRFAPSLSVMVYGEGSDRDARLAGAGPQDVVLVSYGLLQLNAEAFAARSWHTLVLDEAQALKNAAAKRTQAVQTLQAEFRLALSGTPIENRLAELWSIMHICNPGLLGSLARFNERFATPIERDRDRDAQRTLRRLVAPFVLRRTKSQVLDDLPPRTELTLSLQPEAAERAHYEVLRRQALEAAETSLAEGGGQAQLNVLAQLTRLRRAACDPRLVSPGWGQPGAKVQAFGDLAAELAANGHKALVFSQFVDFLALLREPLDAAGIAYQYLDGATPAAERTRRVAAFQAGEGALFLISLKAGGFGLNLTVADYVVIADPWWNPAAEDQASGRAHRIGQQRPVTVYRLVNAGTLEERIVELHQHKRALADGVLEGAESAGALDAAALMELMRG